MIYHKIHICNLYDLHELYESVSSNILHQKMIFHKIHICGPLWMCFLNVPARVIEVASFVIKMIPLNRKAFFSQLPQNGKALFGLQRLTHRACGHGGTLLALFLTL